MIYSPQLFLLRKKDFERASMTGESSCLLGVKPDIGVYSLKWRLTDRYLKWGTIAGPRPGRADADQCKSSDFLQKLRISGFPRF